MGVCKNYKTFEQFSILTVFEQIFLKYDIIWEIFLNCMQKNVTHHSIGKVLKINKCLHINSTIPTFLKIYYIVNIMLYLL